MSELNWSVISCPECSGKFKVPSNLDLGESVACPACGAEVDNAAAPALPKSKRTTPDSSALPTAAREDVGIDLSDLVVRDSNRKFQKSDFQTQSAPKLENLERMASTSDEAFVTLPEEPRERVGSSRARKEIIGWDDEDPASRETSRSTVASTFKLALVALPVVIGVTVLAMNAKSNKRRPTGPPAPLGLNSDAKPEEPPSPESLVPMYESMEHDAFYELVVTAVRNFLAAETMEERLKFTRNPERVRPLMERYYSKNDDGPLEIRSVATREGLHIERGFAVISVVLPNYDGHPVVLSKAEEGSIVVDWEAFVGYSEMTFEEFVKEQPTTPVLFRIRAQLEDYFNYGFEQDRYHCMGISDFRLTKKIYGYVEIGSETADAIGDVITKQRGIDFIIVKLRFPPNPKTDNQVIVDEFVTAGWLLD